MEKFFIFVIYSLWILTLIGILVVTFTRFQYSDLNFIAGILLVATLINTYFSIKIKK